jgi:environmental stress-induced protein Ves
MNPRLSNLSNWQQKRLADAPPIPWRNGGGITHELAAWPGGAAWRWRISVAEVASDGPFSRFEGIDRHFAVLSGAGVRLTFPDRQVMLTAQDAPFAFSGDEACDCQLLSGTTLDFNLMSQGLSATLLRHTAACLDSRALVGQTVGCYALEPVQLCAAGVMLDIPAHTLCWCTATEAFSFQLSGDSFLTWALTPGAES